MRERLTHETIAVVFEKTIFYGGTVVVMFLG
jgi:hypothetical protein